MSCRSSRASNGRRRSARCASGIPSRGSSCAGGAGALRTTAAAAGTCSGRNTPQIRTKRFSTAGRAFSITVSSSAAARRRRLPCAAGGSSPAIRTARPSGRMTTRARYAFTANASRAIRMCSAATPQAKARTGSPRTSSTTAPASRPPLSGGGFPSRSMSGRCTRSGNTITTRSSRSKRTSRPTP